MELLVSPRTDAAPFCQHRCSLESWGRVGTSCCGDAWLRDAAWGPELLFQPGRVYPNAFFFFLVPLGGGSQGS